MISTVYSWWNSGKKKNCKCDGVFGQYYNKGGKHTLCTVITQ